MKRFLIIAGLLTVVATPVFAKSFASDNGIDTQNDKITVRQSEMRAMGPRTRLAHLTHHEKGAAYNGNWGYTPGDGVDDAWRRSRGFWDTNAPGCPLKSC